MSRCSWRVSGEVQGWLARCACGSPAFHDGRELTGTPGPESELGATRCVGGAAGRRGWRSSDVVAESGCGGCRSAGRISGGGGDAEWDRRWRVGGGGFRVGLRDGARGWGACGVGRCVGAAFGFGAAGASVRFVSGSAAFVGVLVVGHRWAPCRIRVVVGTRSCDGAGLRPGGGRDRLAAVLVVVAGRRGRRAISVACTGLLRSPGGRIGGGGRLSSGASP